MTALTLQDVSKHYRHDSAPVAVLRGVSVSQTTFASDSHELVASLIHGDVAETTMTTIGKATTGPQMVALTLGAPEFQRR